jgi:hypothetical protein
MDNDQELPFYPHTYCGGGWLIILKTSQHHDKTELPVDFLKLEKFLFFHVSCSIFSQNYE